MPRASKKKAKAAQGAGFSLFDDADGPDSDGDEDLPKDEAGRQKIKQQYVDLLGIRIGKLRGRILNRERIDKTLEGIYFICARCMKVCHNLDDGLIEDENNENNLCVPCSKAAAAPVKPSRTAKAAKSTRAAKAGKLAKVGKSAKSSKTAKRSKTKRSKRK